MLFNLIGNAVKYTVSGHVEIRTSAFADAAGQTTIKLSVLDTGPGIAPEDRATIFERFKRGRGHASARATKVLGSAWRCAARTRC